MRRLADNTQKKMRSSLNVGEDFGASEASTGCRRIQKKKTYAVLEGLKRNTDRMATLKCGPGAVIFNSIESDSDFIRLLLA